MRKVMQHLKSTTPADPAIQSSNITMEHTSAPSLSAQTADAQRKIRLPQTLRIGNRQKTALINWRAIADYVIGEFNAPENPPEPFISPAHYVSARLSEGARAARGEQAEHLKNIVKHWQLQAGVSKAKANLQAFIWCGKLKRASPAKFSPEAAEALCIVLETLAVTRLGNSPAINAALNQRVVTLLDQMIVDSAARERCLKVAVEAMHTSGAKAMPTLKRMEFAA